MSSDRNGERRLALQEKGGEKAKKSRCAEKLVFDRLPVCNCISSSMLQSPEEGGEGE